MLRVYDMLARVVAQEKTQVCFALLGDANMNFATRLAEAGCKMIYVRHEHCAAAAAMAYSRKSGEVGLVTVTCGPGVTQLMTALPAAVRARIPIVILAGEAPLKSAWYNQGIDQAPFVIATGAAYHSLHSPAQMLSKIRDAFVQAKKEYRPVVLGIPFDLQDLVWDSNENLPSPSSDMLPVTSPIVPNPIDLISATAKIDAAERIIIMAGLGAVEANAGSVCRSLAAACDGLLATSLPARGLFYEDPFSIGIAGGFSTETARKCFSQADLIVAVGCSLASHNSDAGKLWPNAHTLQIDIDPVCLNQGYYAASSHLLADARLGVEALLEKVVQREKSWRNKKLVQQIKIAPADSEVFPSEPDAHDPRDVVLAIDAAIPKDWEVVNSSGHSSYYFAQMPERPQVRFLTIREFGAIGNGISFAMGVSVANPETPVVLFDGDGSLLMHIQELETIVRQKLNILIVVMNDGAYGSEIHKLRAEGLPDTGANFGRTDIASIARGFGAKGERIDDLSILSKLVVEFKINKSLTIWDFPVSDKVVSPVIRRAHPIELK
jgi:thiamine pyrophosphate-dependent acetolactate synthase large subunit-like protein